MDAFALWKQEVDAGHDRIENMTGYPEEKMMKEIDSYWVNVVQDIMPGTAEAGRKLRFIREFAGSPNGEYPETAEALRNRIDLFIQRQAEQAARQPQGGRKTRRHRRRGRGGNPPKVVVSNPGWNLTKPKPAKPEAVVVSNPIASLPRPPKPNPAAGTGLFTGGRKRKHTRRTRRR
jgi:hypothetical protein